MAGEYTGAEVLGALLGGVLVGGVAGVALGRSGVARATNRDLSLAEERGYKRGRDHAATAWPALEREALGRGREEGYTVGRHHGASVERDAAWLAERRRSRATLPDGSRGRG